MVGRRQHDESTLGHPVRLPGREVRRITLDGAGIPLTALISEPRTACPHRAVIVALHGIGMSAGYFHGQAHPSVSLLDLGAQLGFTVLAPDRPGYGAGAARLPSGQSLAEQSGTLGAALTSFAERYEETGAGFFLLGHSYGGKLALCLAAENACGPAVIGLDVSGLGYLPAVDDSRLSTVHSRRNGPLHWGPPGLYPPGTFQLAKALVAPTPVHEVRESAHWPDHFPGTAARIRVPARFTFAEYERWWRQDDDALAALTGLFPGAKVIVDRQAAAGHNISLGWAARSYHLRALGFLEECLTVRSPRP